MSHTKRIKNEDKVKPIEINGTLKTSEKITSKKIRVIRPKVNTTKKALKSKPVIESDLELKSNNIKEVKIEVDRETGKTKVIDLFNENVKNKKPDIEKKHDGSEGHWLEDKMGVKHNASNSPDIHGYEMKCGTGSKTSFGDWCPDIDSSGNLMKLKWWNNDELKLPHMKKYGNFNEAKKRWSWACPIYYGRYNKLGQKFEVDETNNIFIVYNKNHDTVYNNRDETKEMNDGDVRIFGWSQKTLREKVEKKFGVNGYFRCLKNKDGKYTEIAFSEPLKYDEWLDSVKSGKIFFDSGTKMGESRPYMSWRANNKWWHNREIKIE